MGFISPNDIPDPETGETPNQKKIREQLEGKKGQPRSLSPGRIGQASIATGFFVWGMIAFVTGGDLAPYLLGVAGLIWGITAIVWIIKHPVRAFIGFLLIGSLIVFAFLKSVKIVRETPPQSSSEVKAPAKAKPQARIKTQ